jgi:hypothetical protein
MERENARGSGAKRRTADEASLEGGKDHAR